MILNSKKIPKKCKKNIPSFWKGGKVEVPSFESLDWSALFLSGIKSGKSTLSFNHLLEHINKHAS